MEAAQSDALVFFGASGDLAFKQIFPALLGLVCDEGCNVPIVGVAKSGWKVDDLKTRAKASIESHGGADPAKLTRLLGLLRYVDGDYGDPGTFAALKQALAPWRKARIEEADGYARLPEAARLAWLGRGRLERLESAGLHRRYASHLDRRGVRLRGSADVAARKRRRPRTFPRRS